MAEHWLASLGRASVQGSVALLLVWAIGRALPRLSPGVRCWLWRLAFAKMLLALVWTTPLLDVPVLPAAAVPAPPPPPRFSPAPAATQTLAPALPLRPEPAVLRQPADTGNRAAFVVWLLLGGWAAGAAWSASRLARQWRTLRRTLAECASIQESIAADWAGLCQAFGLRRPPRLLVSKAGDGPLLVGLWRPTVVVPAALLRNASPGDVRLVLAHELAHLRCRDLWWNGLPALVQVVFFFHPLVYLAGRSWHLAQEMAADELALRVTRAPLDEYGALLVRVAAARRGLACPDSLIAVRAVDSPRTLQRRLIAMKTFAAPVSPARRAATTAALLTLAALGLAPWRAVAQQPRPVAPAAPAAPTTTPPLSAPAALKPAVAPAAPPRARKPTSAPKKPVPPTPARPPLAAPKPSAPLPVAAVRPVAAATGTTVARRLRPDAALSAPAAPLLAVAPVVPVVPVSVTAAPKEPTSAVVARGATAPSAAFNALGEQIGEQVAADRQNVDEQMGTQVGAQGQRIGELAARLARTDLPEAERAELTRQLTEASQEMAAAVLPIVRESLRAALPAMRHGVEQALSSGKVTPAQIRADLDRSLAEARRDVNNEGDLSPALRREVEQILRDVRQGIEKSIRAYEAAPKRPTAAPPAPPSARP